MPLLAANGLGKHYGTQVCFDDASFTIDDGARIGLIGANGTGKTTLLKILMGQVEEFDGTVSRKKGLRLAVLDQTPDFPATATVREIVVSADPELGKMEHELNEIHEKLAEPGLKADDSAKLVDRLSDLQTQFEHAGGYEVENRADRLLEGVGFPEGRHDEKFQTLSGGERSRVALARLLMIEPDLWLLDEPTNHLDIDGILFVERLLSESKASAVIISHDRRFLDRVTTETWEIEGRRLRRYPAPYTRAKVLRAERIKAEGRAYEIQQTDIAKQEDFIRRYGAGQRAAQAQGRLKRLNRLERLERPEDMIRAMSLQFPLAEKPGMKILGVRHVAAGYGDRTLFSDLHFEVHRGEVIGIAGPNGAGKTTLFRVLTGEVKPSAGEFGWGDRVKRGILLQDEVFPQPGATAFDFIRAAAPQKKDLELRNLLAAMLFSGDDVHKPETVLSGGERKRLMLTRLLMQGNNVLLFDEPTNHLDLPSREAVELALSVYEGTLFIVSHDRYFLDLMADRMLWIEDGAWYLTEGGYAEALEARQQRKAVADAERRRRDAAAKKVSIAAPAPAPPPKPKAAKFTTEQLEAKIIECEEKIRAIELALASPGVHQNPRAAKQKHAEMEALRAELASLESEYGGR